MSNTPENEHNRDAGITDGIIVRYIYSACIVTQTPDICVLHDPWFTEGVYDGSWFHYPKVKNPIESIGNVDCIYVSHIHPDHYDADFLKSYFSRYGIKQVLIANHAPNYLAGKMRADGIEATILQNPLTIGNTKIEIIPHHTGSISDIDSAIILKYTSKDHRSHCVVNANDIIFDEGMRNTLKSAAGDVDILLCGYTGAGPYPQTYFDVSDPMLLIEADRKKQAFFERYKTLTRAINAKVNIPFAGKYVLGGKLAALNEFRGVADPVEILDIDSKAFVLADNGGQIDTVSLAPIQVRTEKYDAVDIRKRAEEIRNEKMAYERFIPAEELSRLPLKRLLSIAARNAVNKSECNEDHFFCIPIPDDQLCIINANRRASDPIVFAESGSILPTPRSEIAIDPRYLFGLLTHVYHWNNAAVGSQYSTRRTPNVFNRDAQNFLNFLAV